MRPVKEEGARGAAYINTRSSNTREYTHLLRQSPFSSLLLPQRYLIQAQEIERKILKLLPSAYELSPGRADVRRAMLPAEGRKEE